MNGNVLMRLLIAAAVGVVAVVVVIAVGGDEISEDLPTEKPAQQSAISDRSKVKKRPKKDTAPVAQGLQAKRAEDSTDGLYVHMNKEDRRIALAIQNALDTENFDALKDLMDHARKCKNAEIRRLMVESLQWFDTKAMLQLTLFLDDDDAEVRGAALAAWEQVLQHVEEDDVKAGLIVESLQIVKNADDAEMIATELHTIDQKLAVNSTIKLLGGSSSVSKETQEKVRETYEFITGEAYTNASDARRWLRENYVSPDDDD